jgi:hypothetical protein
VVYIYNPSFLGAEIKRITVQSQPRQIVLQTLSQKKAITIRDDGVAQV